MGSGFSACSGPASVGVAESVRNKGSRHRLQTTAGTTISGSGGVHSDSCDSGISVSEGNRKNKNRTMTPQPLMDLDSEEEAVEGHDVACGTDFVLTSTPRPPSPRLPHAKEKDGAEGGDWESRKSRLHAHSAKGLRSNTQSSPCLLDHAIHEEDEEVHDGEPEDKRLRAQRPLRPKSAHFRKSRAQAHRGRTARSRHHPNPHHHHHQSGSVSGGESSEDMSSDDDEDFDSDVLSIPDETHSQGNQPNTFTTVKLGPQFQAQTTITDKAPADKAHNDDDMDWWTEDDGGRTPDGRQDTARSRGSSFTVRSHSRVWTDGRVAKKASERSISSILLTTAVELDSTMPVFSPSSSSAATAAAAAGINPACFAVTNPEITQHILKVSHRQHSTTTTTTTLASCMRMNMTADAHDGQPGQTRKSLREKLCQLFIVRHAASTVTEQHSQLVLQHKQRDLAEIAKAKEERRKSPVRDEHMESVKNRAGQRLAHRLRELFVVTGTENNRSLGADTRNTMALLDAEDGSPEITRHRSCRGQTLEVSATVSDSVSASVPTGKQHELLIHGGSERAISSETPDRLKKRVTFSPDIPDINKCSKNYRRRMISIIGQRLRMRNARIAQSKQQNSGVPYKCSLCQIDCIKRAIY